MADDARGSVFVEYDSMNQNKNWSGTSSAPAAGNADKKMMTDAYLNSYPAARSWIAAFFPRFKKGASPAKSPLADLSDAYWVAKYAYSIL